MRPDTVCAKYAEEKGMKKITIQVLKEDETENEMVLIEGKSEALIFLGRLLIDQAKYKRDCGFHIGPKTAGFKFFTKNSTHNIYIHRLPCLEKRGLKLAIP